MVTHALIELFNSKQYRELRRLLKVIWIVALRYLSSSKTPNLFRIAAGFTSCSLERANRKLVFSLTAAIKMTLIAEKNETCETNSNTRGAMIDKGAT